MSSTKDKDTEFQDWILKSVEGSAEEGYTITGEKGWSLGVQSCPIVPTPGMTARLYGRGIGYTVRGVDIGGHECFYRTAHEEEQRHKDMVTENERKRRQEFELKRADYDRRFDALPQLFRDRIARFRANCPTFRWEYESYEVFCCEQAVLIADAMKTTAAVDAFKAMSWNEEVAAVPGLSDGHSGNTMDVACGLAKLYLAAPGCVVQAMGAMVPLVGSVAYGDV